jgi:micrococcal nuclease
LVAAKSDHHFEKWHPLWCLFFVAACLFLNPATARADSHASVNQSHCLNKATGLPVSIARVTDGDTVVLSDDRRIRLIGINTLELNSTLPQDKQWAVSATTELEKQIQSKRVSLIIGLEEFDRHGRTLAHLRLDDGSSVAEALISKGLGVSIAVGPNERCADQYERSEQLARQARLGIWNKPGNWLNNDKQLTVRDRGFRLVTSTVLKARKSKNRFTLELKNGLRVTLNRHFVTATGTQAQNLQGKRIEVRGWLGKDSGKLNLTLSHPSNLRVLPY